MSSSIDQGKLYPPGYNNANPPGIPQFALTAGGGSSVASEIGQAGGSVTVDTLGGIFMTTSADSFIGLDTFNNISLNTSNTSATATIEMIGQSTVTIQSTDGILIAESILNDSFLSLGLDVELQARGALLGGGDVNVTNAGTIAFDTLGAGAITGVQFINGVVYPPPGAGAGTSITQGGAIVATLGNGAIQISSIGVGADVEVYNAGTIRFDAMGAGAIEGVSTINGAAYNPYPGSLSSISGGGATIQATSTIALQAYGNSFLTLNSVGAVVADRVTLSAGTAKPAIVLNDGGNNVAINNLSSATPSYLTMDATGVVEVSGAAVNIANLSTVNGVPFVNGGTVSQNLTVSTLTAGDYISVSTLTDVSSISGVPWPLPGFVIPSALFCSTLEAYDYVSTNALLGVSTMSNATALDIYTNALTITGDVSFSLTDGNGGGISGTGNDVFLTNISTISGGANLNIIATDVAIVGGVNVSLLDTGGAGFSVVSGVVQVNGEVGISSITGLSSINGVAYPEPLGSLTVSTLIAADYVSTLSLQGVLNINNRPLTEYVNATLGNRLQIVPVAADQTVSTITYTTVGSPSAFIPDALGFLPVSGGQNNGWRCTKQVGTSGTSTKIAWYGYNPNYNLSLPYTVDPSPAFTKQDLRSVYAVIYTKNRITTQGQIFFNIYTYDTTSPPVTQPAFTTRFDYSIGQYATALGTGTVATTTQTLVGGYRYLICCVDTPKIVQQTTATVAATALVAGTEYTILTLGTTDFTLYGAAVNTIGCVFTASSLGLGTGTATSLVKTVTASGTLLTSNMQTPGQTGFLRDPYDIHTDIPHVPFNAGLIVTGGNTQPGNISNVPVIGIAVGTDSGTVPVTADFTIEAIGFSAENAFGATENFEYNLQYN
jgi:hypothetical protein